MECKEVWSSGIASFHRINVFSTFDLCHSCVRFISIPYIGFCITYIKASRYYCTNIKHIAIFVLSLFIKDISFNFVTSILLITVWVLKYHSTFSYRAWRDKLQELLFTLTQSISLNFSKSFESFVFLVIRICTEVLCVSLAKISANRP